MTLQVLLVEDEPLTQLIVRTALAAAPRLRDADAPFEVVVVDRLAEARARIAAGGIAAVLLDLSLPDSEGIETYHALHAVAGNVPIVILTATDDEALALDAVRAGAQDWVVKRSADPAMIPRVVRHAIERRRAEHQLAQSTEALLRTRQLAAVGRLAGGMAHAFNNMLTVIRCSAELLRDQLTDERQRRDLEGMLETAQRASALVRQLLAAGSRQVLRAVPTDLAGLVHEALPVLTRAVGSTVQLELATAPAVPAVRVDPGQVEQVLAQLVLEAREVQPGGGTIRVTVDAAEVATPLAHAHGVIAPGRYAVLAVHDDVPLDPAEIAHIFEPFYTRSGAGHEASLGLAVPYGVVRQSGGQLRVRADGRSGTSFEVWLPADTAAQAPVAERAFASDGAAGGHDQRLLVVDDDERVLQLVVRMLRGQGWSVRAASGGAEGLAILEATDGAFDLIVTDLSMPGMDGRAFVDQVRARWPMMRVLFVSGYADVEQTRLELGGDVAFLGKPFTSLDLSRAVREAWLADPIPWPPR